MTNIGKIVSSHDIECLGIDVDREDALNESETAIIIIGEYGGTKVLCRYFKGGKCNASAEKDDLSTIGDCPYQSN